MSERERMLRERIGLALGEASVCWSEVPHGEFDSSKASAIAERLFEDIKPYLKAAPKGKPVTSDLWSVWSEEYQRTYGVEPLRNAKINGMLARLVNMLPKDDATAVVRHYLRSANQFYTFARHPVELLLRDVQKLYTELKTGSVATRSQAKHGETRDANLRAAKDAWEHEHGGGQ